MKWRSSSAQPSSPAGSAKAFAPPSPQSDRCRWKPEPASPLNGLPMNVASIPSRVARSLTAALKRNARSAASSAAEWVEVDLPLAHAVLVRGADHAELGVVQEQQHAVEHAARIGVVADRVDVRRVLDVARPAARGLLAALEQVELELGAHHGLEAELAESRDGALERRARIGAVGLAVGRLVGQAPGDLGRPRQAHERLGQRPSRGCRGSRARSPRRRCAAGRRSRSPCRSRGRRALTVEAKTQIGTSLPRSTPCRSG